MPFVAELTPALAVLVVVSWEVGCFHFAVPNRHRGLVCSVAASVWAAYYGSVGIFHFANRHHALGIIAFGVALLASRTAWRALGLRPDPELEPDAFLERELVGAGVEL